MLTLEERDAIEADYRWYRYSKCALPCLLWCLVLAVMVFCLTAWQQVGNIKDMSAETVWSVRGDVNQADRREGVPRILVLEDETEADNEAGLPKHLRNLRAACAAIVIVGTILVFTILFCKPKPMIRTGLFFFMILFFIAGAVLAGISFAWGIDTVDDAQVCPFNNVRNVFTRSFNLGPTYEECRDRSGIHTALIAASGAVCMGCILVVILLALYTISGDFRLQKTGWRLRERHMETERPKQSDPAHLALRNIRYVRITLLSIVLVFTFLCAILMLIFLVILHDDHDILRNQQAYPAWNGQTSVRGPELLEIPGWPDRNTRLRYAVSAVVILAILLNLIPFTHRLIAYFFGFCYFIAAVVGFITFGLDVHEIREADDLGCPANVECRNSEFTATVVILFLLCLSLIIYVFYEICLKCCIKSKHSGRELTLFEKKKYERTLDSLRPVRCEITGRVMPAKEYVYRWRFIAGTQEAANYVPPYPTQPMFAADGYAAGTMMGSVVPPPGGAVPLSPVAAAPFY